MVPTIFDKNHIIIHLTLELTLQMTLDHKCTKKLGFSLKTTQRKIINLLLHLSAEKSYLTLKLTLNPPPPSSVYPYCSKIRKCHPVYVTVTSKRGQGHT